MNLLGYFDGVDPSACLFQDGVLVAYAEEERLIRWKHANGVFPTRSIASCLERAGIALSDVDAAVYGWNVPRYTHGGIEEFYDRVNLEYPPDAATLTWQRRNLSMFRQENVSARLASHLVPHFGVTPDHLPKQLFYPHHAAHAAAAFFLSPLDEALIMTIDGSGDTECTTFWRGQGTTLKPLHRIEIPHSLGWFYAAMTEYLGFAAYDGEYKVMGLAAYGRPNPEFREKLARVVQPGPSEWDYVVDHKYVHYGPHTYSGRFTDHLVDLLGLVPRQGAREIEPQHEDLAFEVQRLLEERVLSMLRHFRDATGLANLCIGGGVGLNVKLNSQIHRSGLFERVFPFPIPSDSGTSIGACVGVHVQRTGKRPTPLTHLYLGPSFSDQEIERQLRSCGMVYRRSDDIAADTAALLAQGKVVAWFQGALEGGPRALGGRSILADPRTPESRDRVNRAIKFREYWRPFCPSMTEDSAAEFLVRGERSPYMILAFEATDRAKRELPAVVHVDGTCRVQTVDSESNPQFYQLLKAFERKAGVPVLLNTSFNVKGEAIVNTPRDAFRTFWSTGIDALAIESFLIEKPAQPT